ncbi:MAG: diguanylate cyclase [Pseudomonadales bacterium]|nr:diguanylate cyclase [Pseudomonadales bacterium]
MQEAISFFSDPRFMPHGHCFLWQPHLLWTMVISDLLIALAYDSIPIFLIYLYKKRPDIRHRSILMAFGLFIFACGTTHLVDLWNIWHHAYGLEALMKAITAAVSVYVAVIIWPLLPKLLALPSLDELEKKDEDLNKALSKLGASEARYRQLIETAAEGIWIADQEGISTFVNQRMVEMLGATSSNDIIGLPIKAFTFREDTAQVDENIQRRLQGISEVHDFRFKKQDGGFIDTIVSTSPIYSTEQKIEGMLAVITDVTERVRLERELQKLNQELELKVNERTHALESINLDLAGQIEASNIMLSALQEREAFLAALVDSSAEGILTVDEFGKILSVNPAVHTLFGYEANELIGENVTILMPPVYKEVHDGYMAKSSHYIHAKILGKGRQLVGERKDGSEFPIEITISQMVLENLKQYVGIVRDVSSRVTQQEAVNKANKELRSAVERLSTKNAAIEKLNVFSDMLQSCLGLEELIPICERFSSELLGATSGNLFLLHDGVAVSQSSGWGKFQGSEEFVMHDCWAMRKARPYPQNTLHRGIPCQHCHPQPEQLLLCLPLIAKGKTLGVISMMLPESEAQAGEEVFSDDLQQIITALQEHLSLALSNLLLRRELMELSAKDPLTGIYNRRFMWEFFANSLTKARRESTCVSALMLDIDYFKEINDSHGHDVGDRVICTVGEILTKSMRGSDVVGRYGGEEFVAMLSCSHCEDAVAVAEKIRVRIETHNWAPILGRTKVTVSIGVTCSVPEDDTNLLLKRADEALYQAKEEGRNCVRAKLIEDQV